MIKGGITENTKKNYNFGHFDPQLSKRVAGLNNGNYGLMN